MSEKTILFLILALLVIIIIVKLCNKNECYTDVSNNILPMCSEQNKFTNAINDMNTFYRNDLTQQNNLAYLNIIEQPEQCLLDFANSTDDYNTAAEELEKCLENATQECSKNVFCTNYKNRLTDFNTKYNILSESFNKTQECAGLKSGLGIKNCSNCTLNSNVLACQCLDNNNNIQKSSLKNFSNCLPQSVNNNNGTMSCSYKK